MLSALDVELSLRQKHTSYGDVRMQRAKKQSRHCEYSTEKAAFDLMMTAVASDVQYRQLYVKVLGPKGTETASMIGQ